MSDDQSEFAVLLAKARDGDEQALGEIAMKYAKQIRAIARVQIGPALRPYLDSVDIMQSIHRSLVVGFRDDKFHLQKPEQLIALVTVMVRRKVARQWQRVKRQQRLSGQMKADDSLAQIIETVVDQRQLDEHPEFREQLDRILAGLNEIDRKLIELRLNGFNTTDAAKRLSLDPNIARVRLSRARRKLAQNPLLADYL